MFGLIDRMDKKPKVFCVMTNRRKKNLLLLIKKYVCASGLENENVEFATRLYSDCFAFIKYLILLIWVSLLKKS